MEWGILIEKLCDGKTASIVYSDFTTKWTVHRNLLCYLYNVSVSLKLCLNKKCYLDFKNNNDYTNYAMERILHIMMGIILKLYDGYNHHKILKWKNCWPGMVAHAYNAVSKKAMLI
jgi:hypothetical protein